MHYVTGKNKAEKVYFRSQILERPSIGEYWNISGVPVLPENVILRSLERADVIQKLTILECQNGLEMSNTHVPVSGTWSILFPKKKNTHNSTDPDQCGSMHKNVYNV